LDIPYLALQCDQTVAIIGSNGSGKTTLTRFILGIMKSQKDVVIVDGVDVHSAKLCDIAMSIGYLFQNPDRQLFCNSAVEEIVFTLKNQGVDESKAQIKAKELLEKFNMGHLADKLPLHFSRGEKQRLALLAVLAMNPKYFILDEPSSGLDKKNKAILIEMLHEIRKSGIGVCIITHDEDIIGMVDRVVMFESGKVVGDERVRS